MMKRAFYHCAISKCHIKLEFPIQNANVLELRKAKHSYPSKCFVVNLVDHRVKGGLRALGVAVR